MSSQEPIRFPRNWEDMSLDTKMFFGFHLSVMVMFVAGGALAIGTEIAIASALATCIFIASVVHRRYAGWRWRGAGLKEVGGAVAAFVIVAIMFVAVGQFGAYHNPRLFPWFIAGLGAASFNALTSLRLVRASQEEFEQDTQEGEPNIAPAAPIERASTTNIVRNTIAGALVAYGFVSFFVFVWLDMHWAHAAPTEPDETLGLVFRHNEHGSYTYFSAFQATTCAIMFWTSIPVAFLGGLTSAKKNIVTSFARVTWDKDDPLHAFDWSFWISAALTPAFLFYVAPTIITALNRAGFVLSLG